MRPKLRLLAPLLCLLLLPACGEEGTQPAEQTLLPEATWTYPVSQIFLQRDAQRPTLVLRAAEEVQRELEAGRPFADIAHARSDDGGSKDLGGFLGFLRPRGDDPFYGAMQAARPGVPTYPFDSKEGVHFILRHTFEEGRALEAESTVAAHGFFVPWKELLPEATTRTKDEARALAAQTLARLRAGETTLLAAAEEYAPVPPRRDDVFLGRIRRAGEMRGLYEHLRSTEVGAYADLFESPQGYGVLTRKPLLRAIARHVLVRHRESTNRSLSMRRSREEAREIAEQVLAEADPEGGNWVDLVRRYSDDAGSEAIGGSLGVVGNGDAVPDVEAVLLETPPGRVADRLAESPDGFHVLYRVR